MLRAHVLSSCVYLLLGHLDPLQTFTNLGLSRQWPQGREWPEWSQ